MIWIIFSELKPESKKKERRKDDKLKGENISTTDEELMDSQRESCFLILSVLNKYLVLIK